ncbi:hypothetical protein R3P38DRAFT_2786404 [Favolaschia claudopus]|uniref:Uncharacterized protein n=1 Tax=Favolaschia claudopus TaxID=2862362 RepID=A0AAW0ARH2_9AGAR
MWERPVSAPDSRMRKKVGLYIEREQLLEGATKVPLHFIVFARSRTSDPVPAISAGELVNRGVIVNGLKVDHHPQGDSESKPPDRDYPKPTCQDPETQEKPRDHHHPAITRTYPKK